MISSNFVICGSKKSTFVKEQEASWLVASSHFIVT